MYRLCILSFLMHAYGIYAMQEAIISVDPQIPTYIHYIHAFVTFHKEEISALEKKVIMQQIVEGNESFLKRLHRLMQQYEDVLDHLEQQPTQAIECDVFTTLLHRQAMLEIHQDILQLQYKALQTKVYHSLWIGSSLFIIGTLGIGALLIYYF